MRFGTAIERLVDNYQYAKSKIWIRDEVAWALYHTWKEADDRKTEPSDSEKPNNCIDCDTCRFEDCKPSEAPCAYCMVEDLMWKPKDEPQTCDTCKYGEDKHRYAHICNECGVGINNYEPKDEPQTYVINPQEPTNDEKCFECDDFFTCDGQCDEVKDEPQAGRSE